MNALRPTFEARRNSLNFLRLVLAVLVIVSHTWPIGDYGDEPAIGGMHLGTWAVAGFFAISGYLIAMSRERSRSFGSYLWKRVLRIYPAFIVSLIVVAFVFAPLSALISGESYNPTSAIIFVVSNLSLVILQGDISGTLQSTPIPFAWNGSLWTLKWEFLCYIAVGLAVTITPERRRGIAVLVGFVGCTLGTAVQNFTSIGFGYNAGQILELGAFFAAGSLLYFFGHQVPLHYFGAVASLGVLVALSATGTAVAFAGLPLAYLIFWVALKLPLSAVGAKNDISYGMYIYAFPVQQVLVLIFPNQGIPAGVFVLLATLVTAPFAFASCRLVENPAMKLKNLVGRGKPAAAPVA